MGDRNWRQVLVFTRTKHGANRLAEQLAEDGLPSVAIHGNKSQGARTRALADFKQKKVRVLVATDIAARGLDIDHLPHVINYDIPNVPEDYVHRIGRTGRAGREGLAVSLVCGAEHGLFSAIRRLVKVDIPTETMPGFEPTEPDSRHAPPTGRRQAPNRKRNPNSGGGGDNGSRGSARRGPSSGSQRPVRKVI